MIGRVLGHYRVVEVLGKGGMGVVYRAEDQHLDRDVALKVLPASAVGDERARRVLKNESRALSRLNHPNIATVFDFDTEGDIDFLVTELIRGRTLQDVIRDGPLPENLVTELARQLMDGLAAAHDQGVLHRDLKPSNLMITPENRLKILDFGLAKVTVLDNATVSGTGLSGSRKILGTLPYMPPEILQGESPTHRSDIYSAGISLYEIAAGRRAFPAEDPKSLIEGILSGAPKPPREIPTLSEDMARFLSRCMARSPSRRFESAEVALMDLRRLPPSDGIVTGGVPASGRPLGPVAVIAGAILAIVLAALAVPRIRDLFLPPADDDRIDSLVVLPVENLSTPADSLLADGFTAALIMNLSQFEGVRVISLCTSMHYRDSDKTLPEIARELDVDAAVEGTLQRVEPRIRITGTLVLAASDSTLWSGVYDHRLENVLQLQDELARDIAREIKAKVTSSKERVRRVDPAAYDAYLRGLHALETRSPEGFDTGIRYLQLAIEHDPDYAAAHAELAKGYALLGSTGYDVLSPREAWSRAKPAAERALALDGGLAEAHIALAQVRHNYDWDWSGAEESFRRALTLNPGYATAYQWYGFHLAALGKLDEALASMRTALDLDPYSPVVHTSIGRIYYYLEQYDEAIGHFERAREIDPGFPPASILLGMTYIACGRPGEAAARFRSAAERSANAPVFVAGLGAASAAGGDEKEALDALRKLDEASGHRYVPSVYRAAIYANLGRHDEVFDWLGQAITERSEAVLYIHVDPLFSLLRGDSRLAELLGRLGLPLPPPADPG